jgi:hypothetical protein
MNYDTVISWFQSLLSKWVNLCRCSKGQMWGYIGGTACLVLSFVLITAMTLGGAMQVEFRLPLSFKGPGFNP